MSEVSICNMALSHLGDIAQVTSIAPPDGTMQAQLCANFYWSARNALLEMADWGFATQRQLLAQVTNPTVNTVTLPDGTTQTSCGTWRFAFGVPSNMIRALAVIPALAESDTEMWFGPIVPEFGFNPPYPQGYVPVPGQPTYMPQPFAMETLPTGQKILLTNLCDPVLRFTSLVEDTTKFSPLFTVALSYLLASMIAGPLIKGDAGAQMGQQMLQALEAYLLRASSSNANQQRVPITPAVSWMRGR